MDGIMKEKIITDLALAAFLSCIGHQLSTISPQGRRLEFHFHSSTKLEEDILSFYNRQARVDPLAFAETFRNLKALTH